MHTSKSIIFFIVLMGFSGCSHGSWEDKLLSWDAYELREHPTPYVIHLSVPGGGELVYFGARHTFDPNDPQVSKIISAWESLGPTLAFYEGGGPSGEWDAPESAIRDRGEPGLVQFLARRDGIRAESPEPVFSNQVEYLQAKYSPEKIKLFYILRQVAQYSTQQYSRTQLEDRIQGDIEFFSHVPGLQKEPQDLIDLHDSCSRFFPELKSWKDIEGTYFDPTCNPPLAYTNDLARELSEFRDKKMVIRILSAVRKGERVFAVAGASHVVKQEDALRWALESQ